MITLEKVNKTYYTGHQPIVALKDVSFSVNQGEFVSLVGKSGAGKTTLIKMIIAEELPSQGTVSFGGFDLSRLRSSALQKIRKKIGVVHQDYRLLDKKTVKENLEYIMQVIGVSDKSIKRDIPQVLEVVGLEERINNFPPELSGGEKQRLAIARALIHRPDVVIADEPTGNLDLYNTCEIINLLKRINQMKTAVILSTHDREIINKLRKRVITLEQGRVISDEPRGRFIL